MLYQLSYEATHWERGQFVEFISSREEWNDVSIYEITHMNCGYRWKWRMILAVNCSGHGFESRWSPDFFQASSFQLLKLENSLRGSFFTFRIISYITPEEWSSQWIAVVTGSNPVEALIFFFRLLLSSCLNWKIHCEDHSSLSSMTAVQIYELFHIYLHHCFFLLLLLFCIWH